MQGAQELAAEEAPARVAKLRASLKILKRCCEDDAAGKTKILEAQELLVAAVIAPGPASMAATAAAADDLVELALLLHTTASNYPRALEMLQRAWAARRSRGEPASPLSETADALILHRQGRVYYIQGKFDEALAHYQQALEIRTRVLGHEHADVATSYNNIGVVYAGQGKLDEALVQYQKCLEIEIKVLGHEH